MVFLRLFLEFFKTGLFAVGGGLAAIPFLREIAEKYGWYTVAELTDMIAISESTPGPIGVNMATYAGYKAAGIPGGIVATLSFALPALVLIFFINRFLQKFRESSLVGNIFYGLRPASAGLVAGAIFEIFLMSVLNSEMIGTGAGLTAVLNIPAILMFAGILALVILLKKVHPAVFILLGAVMGIVLKL